MRIALFNDGQRYHAATKHGCKNQCSVSSMRHWFVDSINGRASKHSKWVIPDSQVAADLESSSEVHRKTAHRKWSLMGKSHAILSRTGGVSNKIWKRNQTSGSPHHISWCSIYRGHLDSDSETSTGDLHTIPHSIVGIVAEGVHCALLMPGFTQKM